MAKINETNYPRRQASEYAPTDMLIVQPVAVPGEEHSGDSRTTRVSDLKDYMIGDADPSKIGTPAAGAYTSASNTNAQNIAALDNALANYDHLTKQIATQEEINGYISDPTTAEFNVIYLLKDTSATGSDKYYEYMRLGTPQASTFEMTGDTSTDLSNYYTKSEVNTALGDKVDKVSGKGLSTNDYTTTEKNKLNGIEAEANKYELPAASANSLGGIKVGDGLSIDNNGTLSATGGSSSLPLEVVNGKLNIIYEEV